MFVAAGSCGGGGIRVKARRRQKGNYFSQTFFDATIIQTQGENGEQGGEQRKKRISRRKTKYLVVFDGESTAEEIPSHAPNGITTILFSKDDHRWITVKWISPTDDLCNPDSLASRAAIIRTATPSRKLQNKKIRKKQEQPRCTRTTKKQQMVVSATEFPIVKCPSCGIQLTCDNYHLVC